MNAHAKINRDLGTESDMLELVERIKGFDYDQAETSDHLSLARALKVLAEDLVERHARVRALEVQLINKVAIANVTAEMDAVLRTIAPPKRGWFNFGR